MPQRLTNGNAEQISMRRTKTLRRRTFVWVNHLHHLHSFLLPSIDRSARNGVSVIAVIQLKNNEKHSTQNREPMNSPVASCDRPIGAKAVIAMTVAPRSGHCVCVNDVFCSLNLVSPLSSDQPRSLQQRQLRYPPAYPVQ